MSEQPSLISHLRGHKASVLCLETADNAILGGNVLASGSEDRTCRIWDLRTGKATKAICGLDSEVTSVCFPTKTSGPSLYVASGNKVYVYDLRKPELVISQSIRTYEFSQDEINQIAINDKDKYLATADDNGKVKVVDLETHQIYKQFRTQHDNICMTVRFRPRKPWQVLSGGMDSHLIQWDFSRGAPTQTWDMTVSADESTTSQLFNPPFVYSIVTSADGHVVAAGLGDGSVKVLKTQPASTGKKGGKAASAGSGWAEWRLEGGHGCAVVGISFIPTSTYRLISASTDAALCLWDLSNHDPPSSPAVTLAADVSLRKCNALAVAQQRMYVAGVGRKVSDEGVIAIYEAQ